MHSETCDIIDNCDSCENPELECATCGSGTVMAEDKKSCLGMYDALGTVSMVQCPWYSAVLLVRYLLYVTVPTHVECNVIILNTAYSNVRVCAVKIF